MDCPFCHSQIQEHMFASRDGFLAVYNHAPILPGHSLIIPQKHVESLLLLTEQEQFLFFSFARRVTGFLISFFKAEGFDWSLQEGRVAGQSVAHLHLHIIPRHGGDFPDPGDWYAALQASRGGIGLDRQDRKHSPDELALIVSHLRQAYPG